MSSDTSQSLKSIIEHFYHWEKSDPNRPFLKQPTGSEWKVISYGEAGQQARSIAAYLKSSGLQPGDHIGIYSKNCAHWFLADLAIMIGGFVSVPFYSSLPKEQLAEVIDLADLKALFIGRLDGWADRAEVISDKLKVVRFPHYEGDPQLDIGQDWDNAVTNNPPMLEDFAPNLDDLWTVKFTSGTTGSPKGVMHTHRTPALIIENERKTNWIGLYDIPDIGFFSYLPLNHVGERLGVEVPAITLGGHVSFAENLDSFANNLRDAQPSILFAVPRIWTLFYQGVISKVPAKRLKLLLKLPIISSLLRKKLLTAMGLGNLQIAATGAAITPAFIKDFYSSLGIHLIEAYGMTEVCGSITNSPDPDSPKECVGKAIPFGEIKIDEQTSEIMMRSPYMMTGYYKDPKKTAEVFSGEWLHSGDKGRLDENGYLYVTGRVKDAFKTAKGSYVTPNPLEEVIAKNQNVEQVCVAGLGLIQPIAMVNLSESAATKPKDEVQASLHATVEELNQSRAKFERISTTIIQAESWSPQNGLLTPTLKVRRGEIDQRFSGNYQEWHEHADSILWR